MIGTMERTSRTDVESYVGALTIGGMLVIQTALRHDDGPFRTQRIMLSKEAVVTLIPILEEFLGVV